MNKQKLIEFFKKNAISLISNILTFIVVVLLIVLPQTHLYYSITHFGDIVKVVDHMQSITEDTGNQGLHKYMNNILNQ